MDKNEAERRVDTAVIAEKVHALEKDMNLIKTNHLPHIQAEITKVKIRLAFWGGGLAILSIFVPIVVAIIFKK